MPYNPHPYRKKRKCNACEKEFIAIMPNHIYCENCTPSKFSKSGLSNLSTSTVGAIAELAVCTELLKKGYEVFRAMSPSCSCDLAIMKNKKLYRVEVRSGYILRNGNISTDRNHKADVLAVVLHKENKIVYEPENILE